VLRRDPICVVCKTAPATVADHHPVSRRELVAMKVSDPDAPSRLRGLCASCHSRETANSPDQAGGWNRR
jgi:5-methylcytosine-specific restriction protein A